MLNKDDIEGYFKELNKRLGEAGIKGRILMAGGASMLTMFGVSESTLDIDAVFEPSKEMKEIAKRIANENDLEEDWLNDGVKGFIDTSKMKSVLYKEYSNLVVESIDAEGLLAMKVVSARNNGKDEEDLIALMGYLNIGAAENALDIAEKYMPERLLTAKSQYFTQEAFNKYIEGKRSR